jgi:hypothetical protein
MHPASLLLITGACFPIVVSYVVAVRYLTCRQGPEKRFGITGRSRSPRRTIGSHLRWINAAELQRLVNADPELVVFHLLDSLSNAEAKQFATEVEVTLPQLEEALPWMPRGTRFAVYRVTGIPPELVVRLAEITRGRQALLLEGSISSGSVRFDGCLARQTWN